MKLIIDIPEEVVIAIQNGEDYRYDLHTAIAQGVHYEPKGDLISREALKEGLKSYFSDGLLDSVSAKLAFNMILRKIDDTPTVTPKQGER